MAQATAPIANADDVPLIEEYIDTGLASLLSHYRPNYIPGGEVANHLDEQYAIDPSQPLPALSHAYAEAFVAIDQTTPSRALYAMVLSADIPPRSLALNDVYGFANANMVLPVASGTVKCSHLGESRLVIFFERPPEQTLAEVIASGSRLHESRIIPLILGPICNALSGLRERKVYHGNIHPGMFFLGEQPMLGECFSAPAGTLSHYVYEPVERAMCSPLGHGEPNEKTDIYAIGILVYEAMYGLDRIKAMPREEYIERVLRQGIYSLLTSNGDFQEMQDFFRGVLNDNPVERWGLEQLVQFIHGKRFNMTAPMLPKDASRPFVLGQEEYFSRRLLTHVLHRKWRDTLRDIRLLKIERWCETALHRPELSERIERAMRHGATANATDRQTNEMMMRIFAVLDPSGPLRTKSLSTRPDGIALMFADLVAHKGAERSQIVTMIDSDISSFWTEQQESNKTHEVTQAVWRLKRAKGYLEIRALGFGAERALYELNPTLCCQSPLLKPYHVTSIEEALRALDAIAHTFGADTSLVDRHIAAFLTTKLDIPKEIRVDDLTSIPALTDNQELLMLRLLSKAQQKHPKLKLVGLCAWAGMRVEKMIDEIHNRVIRKRQKLQLKKLASTGAVREIMSAILNRDVIARDTDGFAHAIALHDINTKRIEYLQNPLILEYKSRKMGGKAAVMISYIVLTVLGYNTLVNLLEI